MKKIIIILGLVLTLSLAGVLYGTQAQPDEEETVTTGYHTYMNQFPHPKSDFTLD